MKTRVWQSRTWPYGTIKTGKVVDVVKNMIFLIEPATNEGFLLVQHGMTTLPKVDQIATMVFTKGGPTGGYWKITELDGKPIT